MMDISEKELLDYASQEQLFLFASKSDYLAIANGVLELVNIKLNQEATALRAQVAELQSLVARKDEALSAMIESAKEQKCGLRIADEALALKASDVTQKYQEQVDDRDRTIAELAEALGEIVREDSGISAGARRMQEIAIDALLPLAKAKQVKE